MDKSNLIFLDTETTGTGPEARLIQVAYDFQGTERCALFKPPLSIEIEAMAVCHITEKMVADQEPFQGSQFARDLEEIFSGGNNILVAHNAAFDAQMLEKEGIKVQKLIDTHKVAHHLDTEGVIPKHSLQYLRYYCGLEVENAPAHDALGDIRVLKKLFEYFFEDMLQKAGSEEAVLAEMLDVSSKPILVKRFNFGKHKGEKVKDVAATNKDYLLWLLDQKIQAREKGEGDDENWIYTLDHYVGPR